MRKSKEELSQNLSKMNYSGVDNLTEFLSKTGWKKVSDYEEGDMVLQYNEDGSANWVKPIEYKHFESEEPFYEYTNSFINSCQTNNHNILYLEEESVACLKPYSKIRSLCDVNGKINKDNTTVVIEKVKQSEIVNYKFGKETQLAFEGTGGDFVIDKDLLTLIAYTFSHAEVLSEVDSYISVSYVKAGEQATLLEQVLDSMKINFIRGISSKSKNGSNNLTYEFVCKPLADFYLTLCKKYERRVKGGYCLPSILFELRKDLSLTFAEAIVKWYWDTNGSNFTGVYGIDADIIQYHIQSNGLIATIFNTSKGVLKVCIKDSKVGKYEKRNGTAWKPIQKSDKYCLVVPSHMLVLRRKGRIYITGDCISSEE